MEKMAVVVGGCLDEDIGGQAWNMVYIKPLSSQNKEACLGQQKLNLPQSRPNYAAERATSKKNLVNHQQSHAGDLHPLLRDQKSDPTG